MGKKNKNKENNMGEQKEGENQKKENGEGKKNVTVVMKTDLHCEGCATKIIKCLRSFDGVESVAIGDGQKITVVGAVDPVKLREKLEVKTRKKVELISPQPKKEGDNNKENANNKENHGGDNAKKEEKNESKDKNSNEKSDEKKSKEKEKEPPVTTAVLKVHLHCEGCVQKIHKTVTKIKGYKEMKIDKQNDLVTVTGAMDMKALAEVLQKQLKKAVQIVPPKKENEKKEKGGDGKGNDGGGEKVDGNKMQQQAQMVGYPYPVMYGPGFVGDQFQYNPYSANQFHAPQIFSDENPNACSVM